MQLPADGDIASRISDAGGVDAYLRRVVHDTKSLRSVSALSEAVSAQRIALKSSPDVATESFLHSAERSLHDARARLSEIERTAAVLLREQSERRDQLRHYHHLFTERTVAKREYTAVKTCSEIANAYLAALRPLARRTVSAADADMATVAPAVERLVRAVEDIRKPGMETLFGEDDLVKNQKVRASVENRAVDAVIKARAAFVNMLDNQFRAFGWPMNVPLPQQHDELIRNVNFYVKQLDHLQRTVNASEFIPPRTRWQKTLSESWAVAAILRAPLARFKYHFLEPFRADINQDDSAGSASREWKAHGTGTATTARFDRPEWAADFAVERVQEATPFLRQIVMTGPVSAEVLFVEGFCKVFAEKIAYDCELAMRASNDDSDADKLISHAADIASQFDRKLQAGAFDGDGAKKQTGLGLAFPSALALLSRNTVFFTAWASSELRLAESLLSARLEQILQVPTSDSVDSVVKVAVTPTATSALDLDADEDGDKPDMIDIDAQCEDLVQIIGDAGRGCRKLDAVETVTSFLKLTELPLLQSIRSRLRKVLDECNWAPRSFAEVFSSARATCLAQALTEALEDRLCEPFYARFEQQHGQSLYADEIDRLNLLVAKTKKAISNSLIDSFLEGVSGTYLPQVRFGELAAQNAAVVLMHDLSEPLCETMAQLEDALRAVMNAIPNKNMASAIWLPVASRLDSFFFNDVILQTFAGGLRSVHTAASPTNAYLAPRNAAKMARQIAFDASTLVTAFESVSAKPQNFLPLCKESPLLMQMASSKIMRPAIKVKEHHGKVFAALKEFAEEQTEEKANLAKNALKDHVQVTHVTPREALELFAIAGMRESIPLG